MSLFHCCHTSFSLEIFLSLWHFLWFALFDFQQGSLGVLDPSGFLGPQRKLLLICSCDSDYYSRKEVKDVAMVQLLAIGAPVMEEEGGGGGSTRGGGSRKVQTKKRR